MSTRPGRRRGAGAFKHSRKNHEEAAPKTLRDPFEMTMFKLDVGSTANIRILPNDTDDGSFYLRKMHWIRGPKTCTADLPGFDGKCVYCHYYDKAKKDSDDRKNLYPRVVQVAELIDFRYFHKVKVVEKGSDKLVLQECASSHPSKGTNKCKYCKQHSQGDQNVSDRFFGGHKYWELGKQHFGQLEAVNEKLAETCIYGLLEVLDENGEPLEEQPEGVCNHEVEILSYACAGGWFLDEDGNALEEDAALDEAGEMLDGVIWKQCDHEYITERDLQSIEDDDFYRIVDNLQTCPECGTEEFPFAVSLCESAEHDPPVPGSVFDKVIEVTRTGEKKDDGKKSSAYNFDRSHPWSHIEEDVRPHVNSDEDLDEMLKPMDLHWKFRPEYIDPNKYVEDGKDKSQAEAEYVEAVLKSQAERIKRPNPFASQTSSSSGRRSRPFGGGRRRRG